MVYNFPDWNILNHASSHNLFLKSSSLWNNICVSAITAQSELDTILPKSLHTDDVAPAVTKTHVSRLVHPALCTCAQVCAPVLACTQMHRYSSLGRLHQDAIRRAQKWKAITEAIHLTLSNNFACGRNQNQSQSHIQNPSQFLQRANKDYFIQR